MIETHALTVYYGRHRGIDRLDMRVLPGEVYGFLGPNGSGKTTTLRVLLDILRPTGGRATVFGLDCQRQGVAIRRRVGYLPGELSLYGGLRADRFLGLVNAVRGRPCSPDEVEGLCRRLRTPPGDGGEDGDPEVLDTCRLLRSLMDAYEVRDLPCGRFAIRMTKECR